MRFLMMLVALLFAPNVWAAQAFDVTSQRLEILHDLGQAIFEGDVKLVYGSATMLAQKMDVFYQGEAEDPTLQKVEAVGRIKIVDGSGIATGDKATYNPKTGTVLVTGDVVLSRDENVVQGESLTYNLETGDMFLNNNQNDGRVKAIFTIKGKD